MGSKPAKAKKDTIKRVGNVIQETSPVADVNTILRDQFITSPLYFYKKALENSYTANNFNPSQEFYGIVLKKTNYNLLNTIINFDQQLQDQIIYLIFIPDLDRNLPIPKSIGDEYTIKGITTNDRFAIYYGNKEIQPGYIVRVKNAIQAQNARLICTISDVVTNKNLFSFEKEKNPKEKFDKCIEELALKAPKVVLAPKPAVTPNQTPSGDIYSSLDSGKNHPVSFQRGKSAVSPPQEKTADQRKQETVQKTRVQPDDTNEKCIDVKPTNPTNGQENKNKDPVDRAFLKDDLRIDTKIDGSFKFDYQTYALEASQEQSSMGPAIYQEPGLRQVSMIILKEAPYMEMQEYFDAIKLNKEYAAHFCIDYNGDLYQLTDTCNIIKSYNPTIDEISIQIAMLNISYRNSQATKTFLTKYRGTPAEKIDLELKYFFDRNQLSAFYRRKGITDKKVIENPKLFNKTVSPNYRLDFTKSQRTTTKNLLAAINKAYGIPLTIPEKVSVKKPVNLGPLSLISSLIPPITDSIEETKPEIISGDYSGICCPYNFLLSSTNGVYNYTGYF